MMQLVASFWFPWSWWWLFPCCNWLLPVLRVQWALPNMCGWDGRKLLSHQSTNSTTHSLHSLTHPLTHPLTHSLIHSLSHLIVHGIWFLHCWPWSGVSRTSSTCCQALPLHQWSERCSEEGVSHHAPSLLTQGIELERILATVSLYTCSHTWYWMYPNNYFIIYTAHSHTRYWMYPSNYAYMHTAHSHEYHDSILLP